MAGVATRVGDLDGYLAAPRGEGPWPGLVLVHEAFGLDENMRALTDRMAAAGYLTLAPDLLSRGLRPVCLRATMQALRRGHGRAVDDIEAARARLVEDDRCTGRVGVIGFCMGGGFALVLAGRAGWSAAVANYGLLPEEPDALAGACPVVASYGGRDRFLAGAAGRLEAALSARGVPHDVREYPDAGHSFLNPTDSSPWWLAPMARFVLHSGPEPGSADDAWRRIDAFLAEHLAS
ncbi:dienelactone hydrolase family protein [Phycicoccus sp. CSK15P-2]|uniref:dienelactone hydrolase family protein n=1 Tax=Phycicoccus sp. CSK15P-2 TaxID=2807627 RepID=UPI0019529C45|nr:dienelactone hydrolase family protein [Phycicoccus sp. CSK15P-2]MBM6405520.1 dienelactone hydrolase family protein [Phycicoccus sp. CSK15P-2]